MPIFLDRRCDEKGETVSPGEEKLDKSFYERNAEEVAKDLLGKYLVSKKNEGRTVGRIVETEAYLGEEDPASHSHEGSKTERTEVMYGPPGHAYIYLIYGMYNCFNIVTGVEGKPEGVFIRALEPVEGIKLMKKRRDRNDKSELTSGPGKLCMAMGIDKKMKGMDLTGDKLYVLEEEQPKDFEIKEAKRINIDYAGEAKEWKLRFFIDGNEHVSEESE